jgi:uncharacterized protein YjbI with pentapeptide repeats
MLDIEDRYASVKEAFSRDYQSSQIPQEMFDLATESPHHLGQDCADAFCKRLTQFPAVTQRGTVVELIRHMGRAWQPVPKLSLRQATLYGVDFEDSIIAGTLASAHLAGARFDRAIMGEVSLHSADLAGASFRSADLTGADAQYSVPIGADFTGAILDSADFERACLRGADFSQLASARYTKFVHADLRGATMPDIYVEQASFAGANLSGASLRGSIIRALEGALLDGADLTKCDLTGADLSGAMLRGATLNGANLERAKLYGADLTGADLSTARMPAAQLHTAKLAGVNFNDVVYNADTAWPSGFAPPPPQY